MTEIHWPDNLSQTDKEIIKSYSEKDAINAFVTVYSSAKERALQKNVLSHMDASDFKMLLETWADDVGTNAYIADETMDNITNAIASNNLDAHSLFIECHKIKPFTEHNDFLIDVIWRVLKTRDTGIWPEGNCPDFRNIHDGDTVESYE